VSLYRITHAIESTEIKTTRSGHEEWFGAADLPFLHRTVGVLNARHGPGTHRIEERNVSAAERMMAEAITVRSTGNASTWRGPAGNS